MQNHSDNSHLVLRGGSIGGVGVAEGAKRATAPQKQALLEELFGPDILDISGDITFGDFEPASPAFEPLQPRRVLYTVKRPTVHQISEPFITGATSKLSTNAKRVVAHQAKPKPNIVDSSRAAINEPVVNGTIIDRSITNQPNQRSAKPVGKSTAETKHRIRTISNSVSATTSVTDTAAKPSKKLPSAIVKASDLNTRQNSKSRLESVIVAINPKTQSTVTAKAPKIIDSSEAINYKHRSSPVKVPLEHCTVAKASASIDTNVKLSIDKSTLNSFVKPSSKFAKTTNDSIDSKRKVESTVEQAKKRRNTSPIRAPDNSSISALDPKNTYPARIAIKRKAEVFLTREQIKRNLFGKTNADLTSKSNPQHPFARGLKACELRKEFTERTHQPKTSTNPQGELARIDRSKKTRVNELVQFERKGSNVIDSKPHPKPSIIVKTNQADSLLVDRKILPAVKPKNPAEIIPDLKQRGIIPIVPVKRIISRPKAPLNPQRLDVSTIRGHLKPTITTPKKLKLPDLPDIFQPEAVVVPPNKVDTVFGRLGSPARPDFPPLEGPLKYSPTLKRFDYGSYQHKAFIPGLSVPPPAPIVHQHFIFTNQGKSRYARKRMHKLQDKIATAIANGTYEQTFQRRTQNRPF